MRSGLYSVLFAVGSDEGSGVALLRGGRLWGGDNGHFYVGTLTDTDNRLSGQIHIGQHLHGVHNPFHGHTDFQLTLTGEAGQEDELTLHGVSPDAPELQVDFRLRLVVAD